MRIHRFALALAALAIVCVAAVVFGPDLIQQVHLAAAQMPASLDHNWPTFLCEGAAAVTAADLKKITDSLDTITKQFNAKSDELAKHGETALKQVKDLGELTAEMKKTVDKALIEHTTLTGEKNKLEARLTELEQKAVRRDNQPGAHKTIAQQFAESEPLKKFAAEGTRGKLRFGVKAAITSVDFPVSTPSIVQPQQVPGIIVPPKQRLFVRNLIPVGQTGQPAISWVQMTGFTSNARVVSEGTLKPQSTIAYEAKLTPVTTIAHTFKASKQIMDDFKQLQTDFDREMKYGLKYAEEQEILLGDGTGIHLHGIVPQATDYAPEFLAEHHNQIDDIRLAMLQSQLARLPATGIVMHFIDWAQIELTKDDNGQYIFANPLRLATENLWGLPVVPTEIDDFKNNFLTGAFSGGAQIYDREEMNLEIATENNDDFEKNMITGRCEERVGLAVMRPESFIFGEFKTGTN